MKKYSVNAHSRSLGAKMVPFAGYNMPVQYEGVNRTQKPLEMALVF